MGPLTPRRSQLHVTEREAISPPQKLAAGPRSESRLRKRRRTNRRILPPPRAAPPPPPAASRFCPRRTQEATRSQPVSPTCVGGDEREERRWKAEVTNGRAGEAGIVHLSCGNTRRPDQCSKARAEQRGERSAEWARRDRCFPRAPGGRSPGPSHPLVHSAAVRGIPNVRHDPPSSSAVWVAIILVFSVEEGLPLPLRRLARSGAACSLALPSAARLGTRR